MRAPASLAGLLFAAGVVGCSTLRADADWDREVDFAKFRTFAIVEQPAEPPDPTAANPMVQRWIRSRIEAELSAKGLRSAAQGAADLRVSFVVGHEARVRVTTTPGARAHPRRTGRWHTAGPVMTAHAYTQGTLVIDLVDGSTRQLVWHGWADDTIDSTATSEQREQKIEAAVAAILARFPPGQ